MPPPREQTGQSPVRDRINASRDAIVAWLTATGYPAALREDRADAEVELLTRRRSRRERDEWHARSRRHKRDYRRGDTTREQYDAAVAADPEPPADVVLRESAQ